jgi:hypothetical protein
MLLMMWIAWAIRVFWLAGSWFVAAAGGVALVCAIMVLTACLIVAAMRYGSVWRVQVVPQAILR